LVEAVDDASLRFERVDERSFKGISEPVTLFRVSRDGR
jgi:class 3 adenylate cyclase